MTNSGNETLTSARGQPRGGENSRFITVSALANLVLFVGCGTPAATGTKSSPNLNSVGGAQQQQQQRQQQQQNKANETDDKVSAESVKAIPKAAVAKVLPTNTNAPLAAGQTNESLNVSTEVRISGFFHCLNLNMNQQKTPLKAGCTEPIMMPKQGTSHPDVAHENATNNTLIFPVSKKPFCNVVSLSVESISPESISLELGNINAALAGLFGAGVTKTKPSETKPYSTKDLSVWKVKQISEFKFELKLNDDDSQDFKITLDSKGAFLYTVENSGIGCKPTP